jgi:flagellar basal body-associated protein FliL
MSLRVMTYFRYKTDSRSREKPAEPSWIIIIIIIIIIFSLSTVAAGIVTNNNNNNNNNLCSDGIML